MKSTNAHIEDGFYKELQATRALFFDLIHNCNPTWHNQMGKVGYECSWCGSVVQHLDDFIKENEHRFDCEYIVARKLAYLGMPSQTNQPAISVRDNLKRMEE